ncbi:hypothetical protein LINGRAHAP2_LOCUS12939 [Linum grandiflorum]
MIASLGTYGLAVFLLLLTDVRLWLDYYLPSLSLLYQLFSVPFAIALPCVPMAAEDDNAVFSYSTEAVAVGWDRAATSLIARFFFPEPKPARLIQATLSSIYGLVRTLTVIELGFNLHQLFFSTREAMQRVLKRRPIAMDGYFVNVSPWRAPSPDLFRSLQYMKLWVHLELVLDELRSTKFASGFLGLIGAVQEVGMFSSPDLPGYFLRGFVRLDLLRPFFGRRLARDEKGNEYWVRLCYEGLPPVCFRCGRLGHNHGRCLTPDAPLDLEERGPWMSLPAGVYRRVNGFTLQLEPSRRVNHSAGDRRSLLAPTRDGSPAISGALLPTPRATPRSGDDRFRSDASSRHWRPPPPALCDGGSVAVGKRPLLNPGLARPSKCPLPSPSAQLPTPASPESVGSSSATLPPGFPGVALGLPEPNFQ